VAVFYRDFKTVNGSVSIYVPAGFDAKFRFDTVHGRFESPVWVKGDSLYAKGRAIKLIQANPKKFSFATPGIGTTPDLAVALFRLMAKLDVTSVPYAGAGPAVTAVIGNQVGLGCMAMPPTAR
jgi:tripartite-type tricarboxylate transporter receptor subunit TctC